MTSPELVIGVLEVLPGKDHSWAGVDRQGEAVVEIHVVQPVLRHLQGEQGRGAITPKGHIHPLPERAPCLWAH